MPTIDHRLPLVFLMGATATGKTQRACDLAVEFPLDLVSVDSTLVYRGMDIGTAKPTLAERAAVPHHLIDIRDPLEGFSAGDFVRAALAERSLSSPKELLKETGQPLRTFSIDRMKKKLIFK